MRGRRVFLCRWIGWVDHAHGDDGGYVSVVMGKNGRLAVLGVMNNLTDHLAERRERHPSGHWSQIVQHIQDKQLTFVVFVAYVVYVEHVVQHLVGS